MKRIQKTVAMLLIAVLMATSVATTGFPMPEVSAASNGEFVIESTEKKTEDLTLYTVQEREYDSMDEAVNDLGEQFRAFALRREAKHVRIRMPFIIHASELSDLIPKDETGELDPTNFNKAVKKKVIEEGTGNPEAGACMSDEYSEKDVIAYNVSFKDGIYTGNLQADFVHTSPDESYYAAIEEANKIVASMNLDGKSDLEKVQTIADWLHKNMTYQLDFELGDNTAFTYAITNKTGDCTCYAQLFYYFASKAGLNALVDRGAAGNGLYHVWNLVKLDGTYYYIDTQGIPFSFTATDPIEYLYGKNDISHTSSTDIADEYPVAEYMYSKDHSECNGNHEMFENGTTYGGCYEQTCYSCKNCAYQYWVPTGENDNHKWDDGVVTQEATCTEPEITTYTCKNNLRFNCGHSKKTEETAPALGHDYQDVTVAATCTEDGYTAKECSRCGDVIEKKTLPATGHSYKIEITEATCTEPGTEVKICSVCGDRQEKETEKALGHQWDDGVKTEPTCTKEGNILYTCERCGGTKTETLDKIPHNYQAEITKAATCVEDGVKTFTCSGCGDSYTETIKKTGHHYEKTGTVEAGCETDQIDVYTCNNCGATENRIVEDTAKGHAWNKTSEKAATCTESGTTTYTCSRCKETKEETLPATGHQNLIVKDKKNATCTSEGYTGDTWCEDCNTKIETGKKISALEHNWDKGTVTKEPTFTEQGIRLYTCQNCGATKEEKIPIKNHTTDHIYFTEYRDKEPTCMEPGILRIQCDDCEYYTLEEIPKTTHKKSTQKANVSKATCTEAGYTGDTVCKFCGTIMVAGETIPALGHDWDNGTITKKATCKEDGIKTYHCSRCTETKTETIPKSEIHTWDNGKITTQPSCTATGEKIYTCTVCGKTKKESVAKTEHDYQKTVLKEATCKEVGTAEYKCKHCDASYKEDIPKKSHTYTAEITKEATCKEVGTKTYTCENCGDSYEENIPVSTKHSYGAWKNVSPATVMKQAVHKHTCKVCGKSESVAYGSKLKAKLTVNASSLKLKTKQSTSKFKVSYAAGDYVKSWTSSNKKIVTVSGKTNGTCKLKAGSKTGSAKVTIKLASGLSKTIKVTIQKKAVATTSIKNVPKKITLKKGKTYKLSPTIAPITSTSKTSYKSSKSSVAKVSKSGVITAKMKGKATITVQNGKKKVKCTVIVQ